MPKNDYVVYEVRRVVIPISAQHLGEKTKVHIFTPLYLDLSQVTGIENEITRYVMHSQLIPPEKSAALIGITTPSIQLSSTLSASNSNL